MFRRPQLPKRRPEAVSPPDRTPPPGEVTKFPVASAVHGKERGGEGTWVGRRRVVLRVRFFAPKWQNVGQLFVKSKTYLIGALKVLINIFCTPI